MNWGPRKLTDQDEAVILERLAIGRRNRVKQIAREYNLQVSSIYKLERRTARRQQRIAGHEQV